VILALSSVSALDSSLEASPQGFNFVCAQGVCPSGSYQNQCPQCGVLTNEDGTSTLQCYCFDSSDVLHDVSNIQDFGQCTSIDVTNGQISCGGSSALQKTIRNRLNKKKVTSPPATSGSTYVKFTFSCEAGSCPSGSYQQFCPLCSQNSGANTLTCKCFSSKGYMNPQINVMYTVSQCTTIATQSTGLLVCSSNTGIQTE